MMINDKPLCVHGLENQDCVACGDHLPTPPTMPDSFMPEMTTMLDPITDNELRIGVAYDETTGERFELGYALSTRNWREGRQRQPQADAGLRYSLWLALHGVDFTPSPMRVPEVVAHYGRDCDHS